MSNIVPSIWLSFKNDFTYCDQGQNDCDCDCACSVSALIHKTQNAILLGSEAVKARTVQTVALNRNAYVQRMSDSTIALGASFDSVLVLDSNASDLLPSLKDSSNLSDIRAQFSTWSDDIFDPLLGLLLAAGVLSSPQLINSGAVQQDTPEVLSAWLHLTNRCNLACAYCYVKQDTRQMSAAVARRAVDSIFRSAVSHDYTQVKLKYAGGEPTLNFGTLLAAQERAEALSVQTGIALESVLLTNGVLISEAQVEAVLAHNIRVMLSLDGLVKYQNGQRFRKESAGGAFYAVTHTLDQLIKSGLAPYISITITAQNLAGLPELVDYLLERQLRFGFNFYRPTDSTSEPNGLALETRPLIEGLGRAFQAIERRLPKYSLFGTLADRANLQASHIYTCDVGQNYMVIDCEGNVAQCQMELTHPVTTIEVTDPLASLQAYTGGVHNLPVDQKECRECIWRYHCAGGCPRLTFQQTGRYDAKSPLCEVYKAILPEVVRLEALRLVRYEKPWDFSVPN